MQRDAVRLRPDEQALNKMIEKNFTAEKDENAEIG